MYDVSPFYQTLSHVMRDGFNAKEKKEGRDLTFLRTYVNSLRFHAQVGPLAQAIAEVQLSSEQKGEIASLFAAGLDRLRGDPRSFSGALILDNVSSDLAGLIINLKENGILNPGLLRATRAYLVANLADERCDDDYLRGTDKSALPSILGSFNEWLASIQTETQIGPIEESELANAKIDAAPQDHVYWQSPKASELLFAIQSLGEESVEKRGSPDWIAKLSDFMAQLDSWREDDESSPADYFHQKAVLYYGLIKLVPTKRERLKVIDSAVEFLELNSFQQESRIEWFFHVNDLLAPSVPDNVKDEVIQAFLRSRDSTLNTYARLDRWTPRNLHP